jgi:two-component sensor histidine kinase
MSAFDELVWTRTNLGGADLAHVRRLIATWRPLADLSFSDLLLLAPIAGEDAHRFVVLAQVRPTTSQTLYPTDMVGTVVDEVERPVLRKAWNEGDLLQAETRIIGGEERAETLCIPVRRAGRQIALVTREEWSEPLRRWGRMEDVYREAFERLAAMIAEGSFPYARDEVELEASPRVSDGVIVLDADARITFASPNAVSSLHRLGIHAYTTGAHLREVGFDDAAVRTAMAAHLPVMEEIERGDVAVLVRVLPLLAGPELTGALLLLRDVTDLRRRDRMLVSKDATIREIHHRVKNNLQTIASLLRLQGRRLGTDEARAALAESERRIRSIAIVHETLSREPGDVVALADVVGPLVAVVQETLTSPDVAITFSVEGDAGDVPGEVATPLAVVLNELVQNAVDHAFPSANGRVTGHVMIRLHRDADGVVVEVSDDGAGLPEQFSIGRDKGLGLSIVEALVTTELGGSIEMTAGNGTTVTVRVPVRLERIDV